MNKIRRQFVVAVMLLFIGLTCLMQQPRAQMTLTGVGDFGVAASGCSQATTFKARLANHTWDATYTTLICGLVSDGVWSSLEALYVIQTQNSTDATLNLTSTSFTLVSAGAMAFVANQGSTGDGSASGHYNTQFSPASGLLFTQNSAHMSVFTRSVGSAAHQQRHGALDAGAANGTYVAASDSGANAQAININAAFDTTITATQTAPGFVLGNRSASNARQLYWNGASVATDTTASTAPVSPTLWLGARNFNGSSNQESTEQLSYASIGGSLTATQASNLYSRLLAFKNTVGP